MPFLQFKGRSAVETYHYSLPHHALEMEASRSVLPEGESPSLDGNVIIEGDNLLALKALLPTHAGQVKCIYIDPPYNTGNEGWVYNDNLTQPQFKEWVGQTVGREGEDAARHDKWCCMMLPRLLLLHELLREDGAIFISIDDNEVAHLRLLMDEVFGNENWLANFVWKRRSGANDAKDYVSNDHEYVLVYRKTGAFTFNGMKKDFLNYANPDNDPEGVWTRGDLTCNKTCIERPNLCYDLTDPVTKIVYSPNPNNAWRFERERMARLIAEGKVLFPKNGKGNPQYKRHLSEVRSERKPVSTWIESSTTKASDILEEQEEGEVAILQTDLNAQATKELRAIFGKQVFDYPKPVSLVRELVRQATDAEAGDLVLDSFAGSGTTGHAVLTLNAEDGGNRRFLLVQQPYEPKYQSETQTNLCDKITAERVRRVIEGYSGQGGTSGSFTYARVSDAPLLGDYAALGEKLPTYADLAKYLYYTETSRNWNPEDVNEETGRIGEWDGTSYYLLYRPNWEEDRGLSLDFLRETAVHDPNSRLVVYHEKLVMSRDQIRLWETDNGKRIRSMIVPFQLR